MRDVSVRSRTAGELKRRLEDDMRHHLAARRGRRSPRDYAEGIAVRRGVGAVGSAPGARLARSARVRNLLVHPSWRAEDAEVYRVIQEDLDDAGAYPRSPGRLLGADPGR